jgi:predicted transcriptional regulator of viral defense system
MGRGQFIELKDVAHILDCSPADVVVLAGTGNLKAIKKGQYWIFRLSDVEAYRKQHPIKHHDPSLHGHRGKPPNGP